LKERTATLGFKNSLNSFEAAVKNFRQWAKARSSILAE